MAADKTNAGNYNRLILVKCQCTVAGSRSIEIYRYFVHESAKPAILKMAARGTRHNMLYSRYQKCQSSHHYGSIDLATTHTHTQNFSLIRPWDTGAPGPCLIVDNSWNRYCCGFVLPIGWHCMPARLWICFRDGSVPVFGYFSNLGFSVVRNISVSVFIYAQWSSALCPTHRQF